MTTSLKRFVDEWMQRISQESGEAISIYVPQIKEPYTYITPAPFARVPLKKGKPRALRFFTSDCY
jgi:hypothetical protein